MLLMSLTIANHTWLQKWTGM